jgi:hypothetical protein
MPVSIVLAMNGIPSLGFPKEEMRELVFFISGCVSLRKKK